MSQNPVLVTGGAGYIGSHVVRQLMEHGEKVIVVDNLTTGSRQSVPKEILIEGDIGDQDFMRSVLHKYGVDTVLHFAASTLVPESVSDPLKYYHNNTCSTISLLSSCQSAKVSNFIFSSTAAVYGILDTEFASEQSPTSPINPYGSSKLMTERVLRDYTSVSQMKYVILRYFNVAGSDPQLRMGQSTRNATQLIKIACEAALGKRDGISVYGTDYPTSDGTCIRDYIHVEDLADAHLLALNYLRKGGASTILNCGYGHGYSVREVLESVQRVHGSPFRIMDAPRRPGDPPVMIARADRIRELLQWSPRYDNLDIIVRTSLEWEKKLQHNR